MSNTSREEQTLLAMKKKMSEREPKSEPLDVEPKADPAAVEAASQSENYWMMERERNNAVARFYQEQPTPNLTARLPTHI